MIRHCLMWHRSAERHEDAGPMLYDYQMRVAAGRWKPLTAS